MNLKDLGLSFEEIQGLEVPDVDSSITASASRYGVDESLVRALVGQESGGSSTAVSPVGAEGVMQLMPSTAKSLGVVNSYDPAQNVDGGVKYIRQLLDQFGGDPRFALIGYHAGPSGAQQVWDEYQKTGKFEVPRTERFNDGLIYTADYVDSILSKAGKQTQPKPTPTLESLGLSLDEIKGLGEQPDLLEPAREEIAKSQRLAASVQEDLDTSRDVRQQAQDVGQALTEASSAPVGGELPPPIELAESPELPLERAALAPGAVPESEAVEQPSLVEGAKDVAQDIATIAPEVVSYIPNAIRKEHGGKSFYGIDVPPLSEEEERKFEEGQKKSGETNIVKAIDAQLQGYHDSWIGQNEETVKGIALLAMVGAQLSAPAIQRFRLDPRPISQKLADIPRAVQSDIAVKIQGLRRLPKDMVDGLRTAPAEVRAFVTSGDWRTLTKFEQTALRNFLSGKKKDLPLSVWRTMGQGKGGTPTIVTEGALKGTPVTPTRAPLPQAVKGALAPKPVGGVPATVSPDVAAKATAPSQIPSIAPAVAEPSVPQVVPTAKPAPDVPMVSPETAAIHGRISQAMAESPEAFPTPEVAPEPVPEQVVPPTPEEPAPLRPAENVTPETTSIYDELEQDYNQIQSVQKEAGFVKLPSKKAPKAEGRVTETLEAGRAKIGTATGKIKDAISRQWNALQDNFLTYQYSLKEHPQFRDDLRTQHAPMRGRVADDVLKHRYAVLKPVLEASGKDGIRQLTDYLILRDLKVRGDEGQVLANDLSVADVDNALQWYEENISDDVRVAADKVRRLLDAEGAELVARGKIKEPRKEYFPHAVLDYQPEWMSGLKFPMRSKFKEPYRGYTKSALGSKRLIATDDEVLWTHISKTRLDNAQEDWMLRQASKYDATQEWKAQAKAAGHDVKPLHKGEIVNVGGKPHVAVQWKPTAFKATAVNDKMLESAMEDNMLVKEWLAMRGPKGGVPKRDVLVRGRPVLFLLPKEIANTMDNLVEKSPAIFDMLYSVGKATQAWKGLTLRAAGLPFQVGNFIGDTVNMTLFDPSAWGQMGKAARISEKVFFPTSKLAKAYELSPFENEVMQVALDKDVISSGMQAELRKLTSISGPMNTYDKVSEFRESLDRIAILANQMERVQKGLPVQRLAGINIEGLDPISAAAKVARETMIDYSAVPRAYTLLLSRLAAPFIRFHEGNARNYARSLRTPSSAAKLIAPVVAAYAGAHAWNNNKKRKDLEQQLPDYMRERWHIILGQNSEGNIEVLAPQQPIDMAASWVGLDAVSRIASDIQYGKTTYKNGAKELLTEMGNGWRENARSLQNPMMQFFKGLSTNEDPFTHRKVMPDAVHKKYSEDWTNKHARRYVFNYLLEKTLTPVAQYTRTKRGTEPSTHPVLDWLRSGPLNVKRAFGFYEIDPRKQDLSEHFDAKANADVVYQVWKDKFYDLLQAEGDNPQMIASLVKDAEAEGLEDMRDVTDAWKGSPKGRLRLLEFKLRGTTEPATRRRLMEERKGLYEEMRLSSQKTIPKPARGIYEEETGENIPSSSNKSSFGIPKIKSIKPKKPRIF